MRRFLAREVKIRRVVNSPREGPRERPHRGSRLNKGKQRNNKPQQSETKRVPPLPCTIHEFGVVSNRTRDIFRYFCFLYSLPNRTTRYLVYLTLFTTSIYCRCSRFGCSRLMETPRFRGSRRHGALGMGSESEVIHK